VFDRILVDAPCSSERHLLQPDGHAFLSDWKPQRSKRLGTEQRALLSSAIRCNHPPNTITITLSCARHSIGI
jgi:16S rRNA C967 or C1407 C5-methylase (RsmB/RsmF family)